MTKKTYILNRREYIQVITRQKNATATSTIPAATLAVNYQKVTSELQHINIYMHIYHIVKI